MGGRRDRAILHVDMNSFYASVEQAEHPELRGKPVAVAGKEEVRHGIILTKSKEAKRYGVKTAEAIWEARKKCPGLIVVPPDYRLYRRYSEMAREIYYQYTDLVEPFGLDESWLDVTGSAALFGGSAMAIAREISERVKDELGCTVSVGASWNKIFAKFGSDYRKPDAITEISRDNYRDVVWRAPADELLYVGRATRAKLHSSGVDTIGGLACASPELLRRRLGKVGLVLRSFARGEDETPVKPYDPERRDVGREVKSYGNGLTAPHDITDEADAKALLWILSESVAQRMREDRVRGGCVSIGVRYGDDLTGYGRQSALGRPTASTRGVARAAWALLRANEPFDASGRLPRPIRGLHVRASDLVPMDGAQPALFEDPDERVERLDFAVDDLRRRYGNTIVRRGVEMLDDSIDGLDIKGENTVHPVSYFHD